MPIFDRTPYSGGFDGSYIPNLHKRQPSNVPGYTPVPAFDRYADEEERDEEEARRQAKKPKPSPTAMLWFQETP